MSVIASKLGYLSPEAFRSLIASATEELISNLPVDEKTGLLDMTGVQLTYGPKEFAIEIEVPDMPELVDPFLEKRKVRRATIVRINNELIASGNAHLIKPEQEMVEFKDDPDSTYNTQQRFIADQEALRNLEKV